MNESGYQPDSCSLVSAQLVLCWFQVCLLMSAHPPVPVPVPVVLLSSRFVPSFLRMSSWNVVMFVSYEQIKRAMTRGQQSWEAPF